MTRLARRPPKPGSCRSGVFFITGADPSVHGLTTNTWVCTRKIRWCHLALCRSSCSSFLGQSHCIGLRATAVTNGLSTTLSVYNTLTSIQDAQRLTFEYKVHVWRSCFSLARINASLCVGQSCNRCQPVSFVTHARNNSWRTRTSITSRGSSITFSQLRSRHTWHCVPSGGIHLGGGGGILGILLGVQRRYSGEGVATSMTGGGPCAFT